MTSIHRLEMTKINRFVDGVDLLDLIEEEALDKWRKDDGEPIAVIANPDGGVAICGMGDAMNDCEAKAALSEVFHMISRTLNATAYLLVTEIWMLKGINPANRPKGSLEHVPGRRECLMILRETNQKTWATLREIKREGDVITLGEPEVMDNFARDGSALFQGIINCQAVA